MGKIANTQRLLSEREHGRAGLGKGCLLRHHWGNARYVQVYEALTTTLWMGALMLECRVFCCRSDTVYRSDPSDLDNAERGYYFAVYKDTLLAAYGNVEAGSSRGSQSNRVTLAHMLNDLQSAQSLRYFALGMRKYAGRLGRSFVGKRTSAFNFGFTTDNNCQTLFLIVTCRLD